MPITTDHVRNAKDAETNMAKMDFATTELLRGSCLPISMKSTPTAKRDQELNERRMPEIRADPELRLRGVRGDYEHQHHQREQGSGGAAQRAVTPIAAPDGDHHHYDQTQEDQHHDPGKEEVDEDVPENVGEGQVRHVGLLAGGWKSSHRFLAAGCLPSSGAKAPCLLQLIVGAKAPTP